MAEAILRIGRGSEDGAERKSGEIPVTVTGATDEASARALVIAKLASEGLTTYDGNALSTIQFDEVVVTSDGTHLEGTAYFESPTTGPVQVGEETEDFSTLGGSTHVSVSKKTRATYTVIGPLIGATFGQAIGYEKDGTIKGCDIIVPQFEYRVRKIVSSVDVTTEYKGRLFRLTATMNLDSFRDLLAGENLFRGVEGSTRSDGNYDLTYHFSGSPNVTPTAPFLIKGAGIDGDKTITVLEKLGWDYLWVYYHQRKDATNQIIVPRPQFAVIDQVYDQKNHGGSSGIFQT